MFSVGLFGLISCGGPEPATAGTVSLGPDLGSSARAPARAILAAANPIPVDAAANRHAGAHDAVQPVHDGHNDVLATGVINSVDPAQRKINITHEPIKAIGWPTMTMEFPVAPGVDLATARPGGRVNFRIRQGAGGMYEVRSIQPPKEKP